MKLSFEDYLPQAAQVISVDAARSFAGGLPREYLACPSEDRQLIPSFKPYFQVLDKQQLGASKKTAGLDLAHRNSGTRSFLCVAVRIWLNFEAHNS